MLPIPMTTFSYFLGWCILLGIVWLIAGQIQGELMSKPIVRIGLLLIVIFEWHLIWAALSGMETLLLGLHILLILRGIERNWDPMFLGGLAGLGIWIRPDAILVIIPIAWAIIVQHTSVQGSVRRAIRYLAGFVLLALPYLLMNFWLGGEWWPSTYYAKQLEYAVAREASLLQRLFKMGLAPLIGAGFLLVPGILVSIVASVRSRKWIRLAGFFWVIAFIAVYAIRLPVDYQHGRYMIPVIPALFLLGYDGLLILFMRENQSAFKRILSRSWVMSLVFISLIFWLKGAEAYARDVAVIETEMVAAAKWINANTDERDLIAAHDIGALGYFADRRILDLAGLISPEVIPIIRDESALEEFLDEENVDYLMTFPGWYPQLTQGRTIVYSSQGSFSPLIGGENMTIYRWP
jgi:hypothetical protein